jgi:hypothetical protein
MLQKRCRRYGFEEHRHDLVDQHFLPHQVGSISEVTGKMELFIPGSYIRGLAQKGFLLLLATAECERNISPMLNVTRCCSAW